MIGVPNLVMLRHLTRPKENPSKRELQLRGDGTRETKFPPWELIGNVTKPRERVPRPPGLRRTRDFPALGYEELDTQGPRLQIQDLRGRLRSTVVRTTLTVKHS